VTYACIAAHLAAALGPYCWRIEVAGSIRRGKPNPKDIELVCVPKIESFPIPLSGQSNLFDGLPETYQERNLLDNCLAVMKASGEMKDRKGIDSKGAWGPKYKRAVWEGVAVDIFSVLAPAQWGVIFALRTGPGDFNTLLVTSRLRGGAMPLDMRVAGGVLHHGGTVVDTPEEEDFFTAIGLSCWPPAVRTAEALKVWLAAKVRAVP